MPIGMSKMDQDQLSVFPVEQYLIVPALRELTVKYLSLSSKRRFSYLKRFSKYHSNFSKNRFFNILFVDTLLVCLAYKEMPSD